MCSIADKMRSNDQAEGRKWADDIAIPTKQAFCTLQEEQSLCFLKALQSIHVGQPRITFPSPFCVAGVGRSILTHFNL